VCTPVSVFIITQRYAVMTTVIASTVKLLPPECTQSQCVTVVTGTVKLSYFAALKFCNFAFILFFTLYFQF